jgi:hypothetical protein
LFSKLPRQAAKAKKMDRTKNLDLANLLAIWRLELEVNDL